MGRHEDCANVKTQRLVRLVNLSLSSTNETVADLRIDLLGLPRLVRIGNEPHILERRDAALLALLVVQGPTARHQAAALLWPDVGRAPAGRNLRQRLFRLRRTAGRDLAVGDSTLELADGVAHDLASFASPAAGDALAAPGELLGGLDYGDCGDLGDWVAATREQWRVARRQALADAAQRFESDGRVAQALPLAERLVLDDPMAEHAHRRVMRLHYLRGDRAAALAAYERCVMYLGRTLGIRAGSETVALADTIERGQTLGAMPFAPPPVTVLRPPRLVGRDAEWRAIDAALLQQRRAVVLGEPGIGKSRLIGDYAAAQAGSAVLVAAHAGDASVPYALFARLLRALLPQLRQIGEGWVTEELARLVPELGRCPPGPLHPLRLRAAATQALAAARAAGTHLLVLDDMQCADAVSLELVLALASEDVAMSRWLLAVRVSERPAGLVQWQAQQESRAVEIDLPPLDAAGVAKLLEALALPGLAVSDWVQPLLRHTGGNPMFILETLRALAAGSSQGLFDIDRTASLPLPQQIGPLIERRLGQLSAAALRLAQIAALAGADFSAPLAARVLQVHALDLAAAWRELQAAHVIHDSAFAHDLVREATLRSVPAPIARELHVQLAAAAAAEGAPAARVATHALQGGAWADAALHLGRAAQAARDVGDRGAEISHWDRRADCFDKLGNAGEAYASRVRAFLASLVVEPLESARQRAQRLEAKAVDDDERLEALLARAKLAGHAGEAEATARAAGEALALASKLRARDGGTVIDRREVEASFLLGAGQVRCGQSLAALATFERWREPLQAAEDRKLRHDFWSNYGYVLAHADRRREAAAAFEQAIEVAEAIGEDAEAMTNLGNLAGTLGHLGLYERALEAARRAEAWRERMGQASGITPHVSRMNLGLLCQRLGHYDDALCAFDAALAAFRTSAAGVWVAAAENHLAATWLLLGQAARARQALTPLPAGQNGGLLRRAVIEARLDRLAGRPALQRLIALRAVAQADTLVNRLGLELAIVENLPPHEAAVLARTLRDTAEQHEFDAAALTAMAHEADALRRAGSTAAAGVVAHAAAERFAAGCGPHDLSAGEFWWMLHQTFKSAADEVAAADALHRGGTWLIDVALPCVPEPFRDGFLNRHPVHRLLKAACAR